MTFVWPWTFLGLAPVAAAAILALFRPRRNLSVVASLALWSEALSSVVSTSRKRTRHMPLAWWLLLVGAIAAVLAGTRPVYNSSGPVRRVAIALHSSAELGPDGAKEMELAGRGLISRLKETDRVQLLFPEILGRPPQWMSPGEALNMLSGLAHLPVAGSELRVRSPRDDVSLTCRLVPASLETAAGPNVSRIGVKGGLPSVVLDALGAERIAPDRLQVFAAVRNDGPNPVRGRLRVYDALKTSDNLAGSVEFTAEARSRKPVAISIRSVEAMSVVVEPEGTPKSQGYLVAVKTPTVSVAITGRDDPYLRRLVRVDPTLSLVPDPKDARIVIANGLDAPPGKPALVIDPPSPPAPWRRSRESLTSIMLARAAAAADDPVMRGVDLSAAAIRSSASWVRGSRPGGGALISYGSSVLALRTPDDAPADEPRRVYLAFDLSENNCTLVRTESYVVFLANVMRYLAPQSLARERFEYLTPLQTGANPEWTAVLRDESFDQAAVRGAGLTAPGVYRDKAGRLHAVSLVGLEASPEPGLASDNPETLPLPEGEIMDKGLELWTLLLAIAGVFWLAGWAVSALRD